MTKSAFILMACLLALGPAVFGGELNKSQIGADANWVVHANVEKFAGSKIARIVIDELDAAGITDQIEFFETVFSIDLLRDIRNITICGKGQDKDCGVAIIEGTFDKERVLSVIRPNPYYEASDHGDYVIHSWIDENKQDQGAERQYGSFHGKGIILMGLSAAGIKNGHAVLDGEAKSAHDAGSFKAMRKIDENAFLVAAASGVGKVAEQWEQAMMLKHTEESCLTVGESKGNVCVDLNLRTSSSKTAEELTQLLHGMIAFLNLAGQDQPEIAELASSLKITTRKNVIRIGFEHDIDRIAKFIRAEWKKKEAQKAAQAQQPAAEGK